jgi:hypothetical protein
MTDKYGREHTDGSRSGGQPVNDIEAKALALTRTVLAEQGTYFEERTSLAGSIKFDRSGFMAEALCRALEQHEAFKQEVSDALYDYFSNVAVVAGHTLDRFFIPKPKPDPLVEVMRDLDWVDEYADRIRAALEARGLEIVPKAGDC